MSEGDLCRKIALVNLVESKKESKGYEYVATRVYDPSTDKVADEVLISKGQPKDMPSTELSWALWQELPMLDIRAKQLVGKNKDKYCTLVAIRLYELAAIPRTGRDSLWGWFEIRTVVEHGRTYKRRQPARVLGYTFMDINGDKRYMTVAQLRKEDMFRHAHSVSAPEDGAVHMRKTMVGPRATRYDNPKLELSDIDTTLEDEEVAQAKLFKTLVGGWYTIGNDGTIQIDGEAIDEQQLEELAIPDGILHIPSDALVQHSTVKRIKLPESLLTIRQRAITYFQNLEDINIPSQVKELDGVFRYCDRLRQLDLSHVERFKFIAYITVDNLVLPDVVQKNENPGSNTIGVLEFRNTTNAKRRVLKAVTGKRRDNCLVCWAARRIETNGPVVLGDYKVDVTCVDASALEPNIVGIAPNCSFYKVDVEGNPLPWELGPATEFVYPAWSAGYSFTDAAYTANKLRAATVNGRLEIALPKSVRLLQGVLSKSMAKAEYPNVVWATHGLYQKVGAEIDIAVKMPLVRWVLPRGQGVRTETQIKCVETKLTPKLPELCKHVQRLYKMDLTDAKNLAKFRWELFSSVCASDKAEVLFKEYGMIYVGDYNEVLRGKQRCY